MTWANSKAHNITRVPGMCECSPNNLLLFDLKKKKKRLNLEDVRIRRNYPDRRSVKMANSSTNPFQTVNKWDGKKP